MTLKIKNIKKQAEYKNRYMFLGRNTRKRNSKIIRLDMNRHIRQLEELRIKGGKRSGRCWHINKEQKIQN